MKSSKQDNISSFSSKYGAACMHILLVMNGHSWCVTASSVFTAKSSEAAIMLLRPLWLLQSPLKLPQCYCVLYAGCVALHLVAAVGCYCCRLLLLSAVAAGCWLLQVAGCCRLLQVAGCCGLAVAGCRLLRAVAGCRLLWAAASFCSCRLLHACFST